MEGPRDFLDLTSCSECWFHGGGSQIKQVVGPLSGANGLGSSTLFLCTEQTHAVPGGTPEVSERECLDDKQ